MLKEKDKVVLTEKAKGSYLYLNADKDLQLIMDKCIKSKSVLIVHKIMSHVNAVCVSDLTTRLILVPESALVLVGNKKE